jgi:uncharacterized protein (DUF433 family)
MNTEQSQVAEKRHITADPRVCGGKPCIAGTRIRVWDVHVWHDLRGMAPEEIVAEFPHLGIADVYAALAYYHDNRESLERQNQQAEAVIEELEGRYPSKVQARGNDGAGDGSVSP